MLCTYTCTFTYAYAYINYTYSYFIYIHIYIYTRMFTYVQMALLLQRLLYICLKYYMPTQNAGLISGPLRCPWQPGPAKSPRTGDEAILNPPNALDSG